MDKKPIFIFIDGPDGTGKSTLCKNLCQHFQGTKNKFVLECLPSSTGTLSFIREVVKNPNFKCTPNFRQAIHTVNQVERFITRANESSNVIWDRGTASTFVYGKICKVAEHELNLLVDIQVTILLSLPIKPVFITLSHNNPLGFRGVSDGSYYEELDLSNINTFYSDFSDYLWERYQIPSDIIDVTGLSEEEEFRKALLKINEIIQ